MSHRVNYIHFTEVVVLLNACSFVFSHQSLRTWNYKGHLNILGQDKCFGLFPMLCVIMLLLLFLGFFNPIEQGSEIN